MDTSRRDAALARLAQELDVPDALLNMPPHRWLSTEQDWQAAVWATVQEWETEWGTRRRGDGRPFWEQVYGGPPVPPDDDGGPCYTVPCPSF